MMSLVGSELPAINNQQFPGRTKLMSFARMMNRLAAAIERGHFMAAATEMCRIANGIAYRTISTIDECAAIVALERKVWGPDYDEALPVSMLKVTTILGAILLGAFDADGEAIGFVYSLPGDRNGHARQWSYKLCVAAHFRNSGIAHHLKLLQRAYALERGFDLIEWTFDPLQTNYGHFNFSKLGVVVDEYAEDFYGAAMVPVKSRGIPTDRFIAAWNLRDERVQRLSAHDAPQNNPSPSTFCGCYGDTAWSNRTIAQGEWLECDAVNLDLATPRIVVEIPSGFSDMVSKAPNLAFDWRFKTREIFRHYFSRDYRIQEFALDVSQRKGAYLLVKKPGKGHQRNGS
jgi:predicted GNAT superfamily acetyltransferase